MGSKGRPVKMEAAIFVRGVVHVDIAGGDLLFVLLLAEESDYRRNRHRTDLDLFEVQIEQTLLVELRPQLHRHDESRPLGRGRAHQHDEIRLEDNLRLGEHDPGRFLRPHVPADDLVKGLFEDRHAKRPSGLDAVIELRQQFPRHVRI